MKFTAFIEHERVHDRALETGRGISGHTVETDDQICVID